MLLANTVVFCRTRSRRSQVLYYRSLVGAPFGGGVRTRAWHVAQRVRAPTALQAQRPQEAQGPLPLTHTHLHFLAPYAPSTSTFTLTELSRISRCEANTCSAYASRRFV